MQLTVFEERSFQQNNRTKRRADNGKGLCKERQMVFPIKVAYHSDSLYRTHGLIILTLTRIALGSANAEAQEAASPLASQPGPQ
jgi:hypothetical protein